MVGLGPVHWGQTDLDCEPWPTEDILVPFPLACWQDFPFGGEEEERQKALRELEPLWNLPAEDAKRLCLSKEEAAGLVLTLKQCGRGSKPNHFGVGAPLILVYFSGDWDVCWFLTHGHVC